MRDWFDELDCICKNVDPLTGSSEQCVCKTREHDEVTIKALEMKIA